MQNLVRSDGRIAPEPELVKDLGLTSATTLVMGSMIGSGIFIVSSGISREVNSPALLLAAWLITGFMTITGALAYGELAAMMPRVGGALMVIAILISTFGCNNGLILAGARVYYAMARDRLFFHSVASVHPRYHTPVVSLMVQMVWTCILCLSGSYGQLLDYIIFAVLVFYILTITGLFVLRRTRPDAERPYKAIGYPVLPAIYIALAICIDLVLLRYKPQYTWPGLVIVLLGMPVYFAWKWWNARQRLPAEG